MSTSKNKRLLNVHEAAEYTCLAVGTLYNLVSRREITFVKLGRKLLFDLKDLDEWIERSKIERHSLFEQTNLGL